MSVHNRPDNGFVQGLEPREQCASTGRPRRSASGDGLPWRDGDVREQRDHETRKDRLLWARCRHHRRAHRTQDRSATGCARLAGNVLCDRDVTRGEREPNLARWQREAIETGLGRGDLIGRRASHRAGKLLGGNDHIFGWIDRCAGLDAALRARRLDREVVGALTSRAVQITHGTSLTLGARPGKFSGVTRRAQSDCERPQQSPGSPGRGADLRSNPCVVQGLLLGRACSCPSWPTSSGSA